MAQFAIHGNWRSISALTTLVVLFGMMMFAIAGGLTHLPLDDAGVSKRVQFGLALYVLSFVVIGLGFWSREDAVAMGGIIALSLLIVLDILLRIGVLSFNLI